MTKKLGIIDSGIGGLTLLRQLITRKLDLEYLYVCDSKNVPYGNKTQKFMLDQMTHMVNNLLEHKPDAILIACNTATAETIESLRSNFEVPFIGTEPYLTYPKIQRDSSHKYALILTPATEKSKRFQRLRNEKDPKGLIDIHPLENLAMILERLKVEPFCTLEKEVSHELNGLVNKGYTHLILGCTHYPIISSYIEEYLRLKVINPEENIAKHLQSTLKTSLKAQLSSNFDYSTDTGVSFTQKNLKDFPFL